MTCDFCVCDNWFAEVPGPTESNRLFAHTTTSLGLPFNWGDMPVHAWTVYQELDEVRRDWAFFYFDLNDADNFPQLKKRVECMFKFEEFWPKVKADRLPDCNFLCPTTSTSWRSPVHNTRPTTSAALKTSSPMCTKRCGPSPSGTIASS